MRLIQHHRCRLQSGVTLLETIIVLAIIAGMLALLLPAVHFARAAARDGVCKNNLRQISAATSHFFSVRSKMPESRSNYVGGWTIAILPFLDEAKLAEQLANDPKTQSVAAIVARRLPILSCPVAWDGDSSIPKVQASHYSMGFDRKAKTFEVNDVPLNSLVPWPESPELLIPRRGFGPHSGGYYRLSSGGNDAMYADGDGS